MVLEKTLESPLDCKEIQPVHPKGDLWVFFGRNDAKAETPVPLPGKSQCLRSMVGYSPWDCKESDTTEQLHFTMLVITFLPKSKRLLISWLQSPSAVILEPHQKIKSLTVFIVSSSICHEVMGPDAMILVF